MAFVGKRGQTAFAATLPDGPDQFVQDRLQYLRTGSGIVIQEPKVDWMPSWKNERVPNRGHRHAGRKATREMTRELVGDIASIRKPRGIDSICIHRRIVQRSNDRVHGVAGQIGQIAGGFGQSGAEVKPLREQGRQQIARMALLKPLCSHLLENECLTELD